MKFGGSSIKNAESIKEVFSIINKRTENKEIIIVFSAMKGVTNRLKALAENSASNIDINHNLNRLKKTHDDCYYQLLKKKPNEVLVKLYSNLSEDLKSIKSSGVLNPKDLDKVLSYGEILSTRIISDYFTQKGILSETLITTDVILTDNCFGNAYVHYQKSFDNIRNYLKNRTKLQIVTGFIGATKEGETTTLGRNGSDYTASIIGAAINAKDIEIWSDVDGVLSTNPKITKSAKVISELSYEEAMELAHAGAEVLFPPSIIPALYKNIPIKIRNTFNQNQNGTNINQKRIKKEAIVGISCLEKISLIRLQGAGLIDKKGTIGRMFSCLASARINIKLIAQTFSEHSICFAINPKWNKKAKTALESEFSFEIKENYMDKIIIEDELSMIAVVGEGMRNKPGVAGNIFSTLGRAGINIVAITQVNSQLNISFIVQDKDVNHAIKVLHERLFIHKNKKNIFLIGFGLVGKSLISLINKDKSISLCGLMNSKTMIIDELGINISSISKSLREGKSYNLDNFIKSALNTPNAIIVDATSSDHIAEKTPELIKSGISVVTASKLANSKNQNFYDSIRTFSIKSKFKYEANVGAGLPIIETLRTLLKTGDKIIKIEGIMSGTLSFLFSNYNGSKTFSKLVTEARNKGFTEPDPRDDLNGIDVGRKILILARETGAKLELNDVSIESLIPDTIDDNIGVDDFLKKLSDFDDQFLRKYQKANKQNQVLRYIASWDGMKAEVKLKAVNIEDQFYHQSGRENFIVFKTERYNEIPLVIKGHGAGAEVTAAAVLGDILSC